MPERIDRLNDLIREIDPKGKGIDEDADEVAVEGCESAICRAAAEICGLTQYGLQIAANDAGHVPTAEALRRFAALAQEKKP